jgi:hypothetical protein
MSAENLLNALKWRSKIALLAATLWLATICMLAL